MDTLIAATRSIRLTPNPVKTLKAVKVSGPDVVLGREALLSLSVQEIHSLFGL